MNKKLLYFVYISFLLISCTRKEESDLPEPAIYDYPDNAISFSLKANSNPEQLNNDFNLQVANNEITGFIPYLLQTDSLVATFTLPAGCLAIVDGVIQESGVTKNDFSKPIIYSIKSSKGAEKLYTLKVSSFTGLPVLHINTENEEKINSKDEYVPGHLKVNGNAAYNHGLYNGSIFIKGRGNSTWDFPKKPYKLKLSQTATLLDMPANKEWVLLANYTDKTLLRNYAAFELSRQLGLKFTPRSRFVEVMLNNEYLGNYLLTEQIKIGENRIDIENLAPGDISSEKISGGYLLEIDARLDADNTFITNLGVPFCIKSPEKIAPQQFEYIKKYIQQTEDVLYSENFMDPKEGYAKYINVASFVNWYLLNEITKNTDAAFHSSVYLYKDRNDKLCIGPAWDYDIAFGNVDYNNNKNPEGFFIQHTTWINQLFKDPAFYAKVKSRFKEFKESESSSFSEYINKTAILLEKSQAKNFEKWPILEEYVWPNAVVMGTYGKEVNYLTEWFQERINWLDQEFNQTL